MPRDGSNIYHYPTGIEGVPDTPILSPDYNSLLTDLEQDLNLPRPILAGGTGATSADAALTAFSGEKAGQIVTNYDSFIFKAGSFSSATTATGSPVPGQAFTGICFMADANNYFIEVRSFTGGKRYARGKIAGVWGAWEGSDPMLVAADTALNAAKVNRAGDTITGGLAIGGLLTVNAISPVTGQITINGLPTVSGNPTVSFGIATKQYVDNLAATVATDSELTNAIDAEIVRADVTYATKTIFFNSTAGPYTTVLGDLGKCLIGVGQRTINNSLAYPTGTTIMFCASGGVMTIVLSSSTLFWNNGGSVLSGSRALSNAGFATALKISGDWFLFGHGIT